MAATWRLCTAACSVEWTRSRVHRECTGFVTDVWDAEACGAGRIGAAVVADAPAGVDVRPGWRRPAHQRATRYKAASVTAQLATTLCATRGTDDQADREHGDYGTEHVEPFGRRYRGRRKCPRGRPQGHGNMGGNDRRTTDDQSRQSASGQPASLDSRITSSVS